MQFCLIYICILLLHFPGIFKASTIEPQDDEPLKDFIMSLLPSKFLEKPVATSNHANPSRNSKDPFETADKMLQGLENIFESLTAPDNGNCLFKCPNSNGAKPTAKPGFKVVPNGCGSDGFKPDVSSLPGLTDCCNQHDICYGSCGKGQAECDRAFNTCMANSCQEMRKIGTIRTDKALEECRAIGATFHLAVMSVGCKFYLEAQSSACVCSVAGSGGTSDPSHEKIRQHNREIRTKQTDIADELDSIDLSDPVFDLPDAIERDEL